MTKKDAYADEDGDKMQKTTKKIQTVFFGMLVLLIVIMLGVNGWGTGGGKLTTEEEGRVRTALEQALEKVEGVGKVVIYYDDKEVEKENPLSTFFSLPQTELEKDSSNVKGILVVAEGGGDPIIQRLLTKTLATVLQLGEHQIVVVEMKKEEEME